jgi:hypothetical protein
MLRSFQAGYKNSLRLRNGVEPLFNDIADRERLDRVDDFLLDTACPAAGEFLDVTVPDTIEWMTEGRRFIATPPGLSKTRTVRVRRFWYTHANGAVGYHLSFRYNYDHTPGDFFFLSLIQKLAAPKEFELKKALKEGETVRPTDPETGIAPLDAIKVKSANGTPANFWHYVRDTFEADAAELFGELKGEFPPAKGAKTEAPTFKHLAAEAPFIEVPGLTMPVSRLLFFFEDKTFFRRLLPEVDPVTEKPTPRTLMVQEGCYAPFQTELADCEGPTISGVPQFQLTDKFWAWVINRPDYDQFTDEQISEARKNIPAMENRKREDCLQYLFLAGFNQNIIDFMNQDPSEILDSTDPIFPSTEEQISQRKFVRFANPRALISYVEKARSLEAANDFIGTCPYAFMVHVVSMHNEFMTREYERSAFSLIDEVEKLNAQRKQRLATDHFYKFRIGDYAAYYRDRYTNIFRYDTERDVFDSMMQLRGIERRNAYIETLISNLESQTHDREARIKQDDDKLLTAGLGALGIFGLFQVAFEWGDKLKYFADPANLAGDATEPGVRLSPLPPFVNLTPNVWLTPWDGFSAATLIASWLVTLAGAFALVGWLLWIALKRK